MASSLADTEMRALLAKSLAAVASSSASERSAAADKLAALSIVTPSSAADAARADVSELLAVLKAGMDDAAPAAREGAFVALQAVVKSVGAPAEPFLVALLPVVLDKLGDKVATVNTAAMEAARAIVARTPSSAAVSTVLPTLMHVLDVNKKWQARQAALQLVALLPAQAPIQIAAALPSMVPRLTDAMGEVRAEVSKAAEAATLACCTVLGNKDVEALIPAIVSALARPAEVPECTYKLSATTFVQAVDAATLSVVTPILARGLAERTTAVRRRCAVIISNFVKLVSDPLDAAPLVPKLLPGLCKLRDEGSDPELREVATRAQGVLATAAGLVTAGASDADVAAASASSASGAPKAAAAAPAKPAAAAAAKGGKAAAAPVTIKYDNAQVLAALSELVLADRLALTPWGVAGAVADASPVAEGKGDEIAPLSPSSSTTLPDFVQPTLEYVAALGSSLAAGKNFEPDAWHAAVVPYLSAYLPAHLAGSIAAELRARLHEKVTGIARHVEEVVEEGDVLCDCRFSLAYGAKILLHEAHLRLLRGKRYGLCGYNGCGKSTLMRAIANGQLEGFPPKEVLKTVFVENTTIEDAEGLSVLQFVMNDELVKEVTTDEATIVAALESVGFNATMRASPVGALSGGWRMKLSLARAQLQNPDIYLLDEPTNHLDFANVKWLTNFLVGLTTATCIIVSHDSGFLDYVCSHIVHYEGFHLKTYRGNLTELVKVHPEAQSYYDLSASTMSFNLPEPGFLEGVKSKDRAILRMSNVGFKYPGTDRMVVTKVNLAVSLASRVVVLGANGAGKSTVIKMLTGVHVPTEGTVWKHPNLRIAYVAQHAFHHLDDHVLKTPSEYIQWRYASGEDRESEDKESRKITAEEEAAMAKAFVINGAKVVVEQVLVRRKLRSSYEYEVSFVGQPADKNKWLPRDVLVAAGFEKLVVQVDAREAAAAGLHSTPLTAANIAKHLASLGLEHEITLHNRISGLSGGQKLKLILGACTWMHPHVIVMDEPTNFLDRDSLGALSGALKNFNGGVVLITHHADFTKELCGEQWLVDNGTLTSTGGSYAAEAVKALAAAESVVDAMGNEIKVKPKLSEREKKRRAKERKAARARGEDVPDTDEDEM